MTRVLLFACYRWPSTAQIARALARAGFEVGLLGPAWHPARLLGSLAFTRSYTLPGKTAALTRLVREWQPHFVIPGDERALAVLHRLRDEGLQGGPEQRGLAAWIERSLGGFARPEVVLEKSRLVRFAAELGIAVPETRLARTAPELDQALGEISLPAFLKRDSSWGGAGVRAVASAAEAQRVLRELAAPPGWAGVARTVLRQQDLDYLRERLAFTPPGVTLQARAAGKPVNRAVACWEGQVLGGLTLETLHALPENGPSTVVRSVRHAGIEDAARRLVAALGLSGFIGFDFMLDPASGQAWLLEMNPRATPGAQLLLEDRPAIAARLRAAMAGRTAEDGAAAEEGGRLFVLFPQELQRNPRSPYLGHPAHLVPWDEPRFLRHGIAYAERRARGTAPPLPEAGTEADATEELPAAP